MITGTLVNAAAVIAGGAIGMTAGKKMNSEMRNTIFQGMALCVMVLGIKMSFSDHDFFPVIVCLAIGAFIGEMLSIERQLEQFGEWIQGLTKNSSGTFVQGFVAASLLYCVGSMTIIGSINDGINGDSSVLFIKSVLDGITSIFLASTLGVGVLFSALVILLYQGSLSLLAGQLEFLVSDPVYVNGISSAGGVLILAIGINMMGIARIRTGNLLPAIFLVPLWDWIAKLI